MSVRTTCREVHDHASDLLEAAGENLEGVRDHLAICPPCQEYLRQLGLTVELIQALPGEPGAEARSTLKGLFQSWCRSRDPK